MKKTLVIGILVFVMAARGSLFAQEAAQTPRSVETVGIVCEPPVVNARVYRVSDARVVVYYDLDSTQPCDVSVLVSVDGGSEFAPLFSGLTGDFGSRVSPGKNRRISWALPESMIKAENGIVIRLATGTSPHMPEAGQPDGIGAVVYAQRIHSQVTLDGKSDEAAWESIEPLPAIMQVPHFGAPPTEKTEILIGYDDNYLYIAGRLYDSDPGAVHATTMKRDDTENSSDSFGIVIDTFNDNENALVFITTPTGSRTDLTISADLQQTKANSSWNTFWDVETAQTPDGWFTEMRIPFKSLGFQDINGRVEMGLSVFRWIARKDERVIFPAIPRNWGLESHMKPSQARTVVFEGIERKRPLYFTPYFIGGLGRSYNLNDTGTGYKGKDDDLTEAGLDIKYGLTSNLTLDLTYNTDFAQVEADDQQVNLTRYPLFYPEKRLFFLERASTFEFNFYRQNRLFHSRRIGIHEGRRVPIYGGARIVGRLGGWDVGLLSMQSEEIEDLPSENFGVLRLRRQVFNPYSYIGGIVTSRMGADDSFNTAYGLDGIFRVFGDDYLKLNWAQTFENGADNESATIDNAKIRAHWERYRYTRWAYGVNYSRSGPDYNPGLGFEQYVDTTNIIHFLRYGWTPGEKSFLFQHRIYEDVWLHIRNTDNTMKSQVTHAGWIFSTKSGYWGHLWMAHNLEDVREPLSFSEYTVVPPGRYEFFDCMATVTTPKGRLFNLKTTLNVGEFYDGRRATLELEPSRSLSSHLEVGGLYQFNRVEFDTCEQEFTAHISRLRLLAMLNVKLSMTAFVQYNSDNDKVISNVRFRYNPREGCDLYLVYDEGFNTDQDREIPMLPFTENRTVLLKYNYTFNL